MDYNSGNPLGVGWLQATIKDGVRSSSATSYLAPKFVDRRNLHVLVNARVTRVRGARHSKAFDTVDFVFQSGGKCHIYRGVRCHEPSLYDIVFMSEWVIILN